MKKTWRDNGLSFTMFALFALFLCGQSVVGWKDWNDDLTGHGHAAIAYGAYLVSGDFWGAVFENWESEFLQMSFYVLLTVWLFQRGSSESKDPDKPSPVDEDPQYPQNPTDSKPDTQPTAPRDDAPGPVRRGGWRLKMYENSLFLALFGIFVFSFLGHLWSGSIAYSHEQNLHGQPSVSVREFLFTSRFWFQSLQNWQSEFLAVGSLIVLSIRLRQKGSPESKPVARPHHETGTD